MKINKTADQNSISNHVFDKLETASTQNKIVISLPDYEVTHILKMAESITEDEIIIEKDRIENFAKSHQRYLYNSHLPDNVKKELVEYAKICGLSDEELFEIAPEELPLVSEASSKAPFIKTASATSEMKDKLSQVWGDPFHLDAEKQNIKEDWEKVEKAQKLGDKPILSNSTIHAVRGEDNYSLNPEFKTTRGRNSILEPDAIEKLAEKPDIEFGTRLKQELANKEQIKKDNKKQWEDDKINAMEHRDMLPKGQVFLTESMNAQPGLSSPASERIINKYSPDNIPNKTAGEMIKETNENRKRAIQREEVPDNWQSVKKESFNGISTDFAESLKKLLKK